MVKNVADNRAVHWCQRLLLLISFITSLVEYSRTGFSKSNIKAWWSSYNSACVKLRSAWPVNALEAHNCVVSKSDFKIDSKIFSSTSSARFQSSLSASWFGKVISSSESYSMQHATEERIPLVPESLHVHLRLLRVLYLVFRRRMTSCACAITSFVALTESASLAAAMICRREVEPWVEVVDTKSREVGLPLWYWGTGKGLLSVMRKLECKSAALYGPITTQSMSWCKLSPSKVQASVSISDTWMEDWTVLRYGKIVLSKSALRASSAAWIRAVTESCSEKWYDATGRELRLLGDHIVPAWAAELLFEKTETNPLYDLHASRCWKTSDVAGAYIKYCSRDIWPSSICIANSRHLWFQLTAVAALRRQVHRSTGSCSGLIIPDCPNFIIFKPMLLNAFCWVLSTIKPNWWALAHCVTENWLTTKIPSSHFFSRKFARHRVITCKISTPCLSRTCAYTDVSGRTQLAADPKQAMYSSNPGTLNNSFNEYGFHIIISSSNVEVKIKGPEHQKSNVSAVPLFLAMAIE